MYDSIKMLNKYNNTYEIKKQILHNYNIENNINNDVFIFGVGRLGKYVLNALRKNKINVLGFIDNNKNIQGSIIDGLKVYSLLEAKKANNSLIVICSLNYLGEIYEQLIKADVNNFIPYPVLYAFDSKEYGGFSQSIDGVIEDLIENKDKYINLFSEIKDEISLQILDNILLYRLTFNIKYLIKGYKLSDNESNEYFDKQIVKISSNEVFVDGGAYKGETTKDFIKYANGHYKKIYLFEPDNDLIKICKENLSSYENIEYLPYGISNTCKEMKFEKTSDAGGKINENGDTVIKLNYIDNIINDQVSFIKLDIEGAEGDAIDGASYTINRYKPKMAISAYHKPEDIWQLYNKVKKINNTYKLYVRHYSKGIFDTDFYFI